MYFRRIFPLMRTLIGHELRVANNVGVSSAIRYPLSFVATQSALHPHNSIEQVRCYAKTRDIKKEKSKKGSSKVEINEDQLREFVNLDGMKLHMQKAVTQMKEDYVKHLSLRSTTGAIDTLHVKVDGTDHELQQLAQISRKNPKTIVVNMIAFPQAIPEVLKAIEKSGMNLNPQQDGTTLFIAIPKVTREHRENLSKNAKTLFVKYRDAVRDVQTNTIKKLKKQTDVSKDQFYAIQAQITAIADQYIMEVERLLAAKQKELLGD